MPKQQQLSSSSIVPFLLFVVLCCCSSWSVQVHAFVSPRYPSSSLSSQQQQVFDFRVSAESGTGETDPKEIIARRIIVEGDVEGGYYRSCVRNEVGNQHKTITQRSKRIERERGNGNKHQRSFFLQSFPIEDYITEIFILAFIFGANSQFPFFFLSSYSCVLFYLHNYNSIQYQASRFRSLSGTMTPPDDSRRAEIYVEVRLLYSYIIYITYKYVFNSR